MVMFRTRTSPGFLGQPDSRDGCVSRSWLTHGSPPTTSCVPDDLGEAKCVQPYAAVGVILLALAGCASTGSDSVGRSAAFPSDQSASVRLGDDPKATNNDICTLAAMKTLASAENSAARESDSNGKNLIWNLMLPPSRNNGHTGRISVTALGQVHEGSGSTGTYADYHFHPREHKSGGLGPAIPWNKDFKPIGNQAAYTAPALNLVGRHMEAAALNADWEMLVEEIAAQQEPLASAVTQFLLAHALLSLNRNNEAFLLFWSGNSETQRKAWLEWTSRLIERNPHNAVAHYLRGDALARLGEWRLAIEGFNNALRLDLRFLPSASCQGHCARRNQRVGRCHEGPYGSR